MSTFLKPPALGVKPKGEPFVLVINAKKKIFIGDVEIPNKNLREKLKSIFSKRKTKQVYLQADKKSRLWFCR